MEEYEKFCEKSLTRIQEASLSTESFLPVQSENSSLIRFHGVAVLSPLLNIEKRKEMQQEKQKALEVEARKQVNRKKALLTRVQEIIENIQVRKAPNASDFDQWETETIYSNSEVRTLDVPATFPNVLPSPSEHSTFTEFEKLIGILPLDIEDQFKSNGIDLARDSEEFNSLKQCDSSNMSPMENEASLKSSPAAAEETLISDGLFPQNEKQDPSLLEEVTSDPYIMSLQKLMKKSKEYIEREHSRRSLRNSAKGNVNESHSDKENDAGRVTAECVKEKTPPMGRPCGPVIPDKPSLNQSNVLLQGASTQASSTNTAVLGSFSKADIPAGTGHPTVSDPDSDFKVIPTFVTENNVIKSLTSSYAKLPSPEPSLSPKMHRRRSRPLSACHILINNPVNACELSPKGKEQAVDLAVQDTDGETNVLETVPKLPIDLTRVCSSKIYAGKNTSEAIQEMVLGKSNQVCQSSGNQLEKKVFHGLAVVEDQLTSDGRGPHTLDGRCTTVPRSHEPCATGPCVATQNFGTLSGLKSASMSEKNCNSQMELNKSYDVKNPSPLLMQNPNTGEQVDTPTVSCGNERFLDNSFEKVKRRLELDIDSLQKENCPYVITAAIGEQERQHLPEKRYHIGSVCINKNHFLESFKEGEETLKSKMLAFEEMRKRLEEQHAQQLSLLVAEQEREQEQLQKEIEEQEKTFREKRLVTAEASEPDPGSAAGLPWRPASGSGALETVQASRPHTSGFINPALQHSFGSTNEAPFYLWGSSASSLTKLSVTRPFGRAITKWSQVCSLEIQTKFNKITAVAKGFLTRRLMQTDKLKQLRQTVKDTMEFIRSFQSEAPLKRGVVSAQDASLQERVLAQLRAALYGIHDIFFVMDAAERMSILRQDREARKEKMLRQMDKMKSPRVALSAATQKSLDRKKYMKAAEMGMPNKKFLVKQNPSETRVLQPNQGQNAPVHRLLSRQGTPKTSVKGVVQDRQTSSRSRAPRRAPVAGVYAGKIQRKRPNVATI